MYKDCTLKWCGPVLPSLCTSELFLLLWMLFWWGSAWLSHSLHRGHCLNSLPWEVLPWEPSVGNTPASSPSYSVPCSSSTLVTSASWLLCFCLFPILNGSSADSGHGFTYYGIPTACVFVCVCVCTCMHVYVYMPWSMHVGQRTTSGVSLWFAPCFRKGFIVVHCYVCQDSFTTDFQSLSYLCSLLIKRTLGLQMCDTMFIGASDSNSGPHICVANILCSSQSPELTAFLHLLIFQLALEFPKDGIYV